MAWFMYKCGKCDNIFKVNLPQRLSIFPCDKCESSAKVMLKSASGVRIVERLDNGLMGRAVERLHNIEEINDELTRKHAPKDDNADFE